MKSVNDLLHFHEADKSQHVIIAYEGELNPHITSSVISLAEKNLDRKQLELPSRRKAFHIAVECLQNISAHGEKESGSYNSIFIIGQNGPDFFISSGNVIKADKVENLQRKIDQINNLDKDGLKQLHMQAIKESLNKPECSNAGLGLISIARKSGRKIDYQFAELEGGNAFFSFHASFGVESLN